MVRIGRAEGNDGRTPDGPHRLRAARQDRAPRRRLRPHRPGEPQRHLPRTGAASSAPAAARRRRRPRARRARAQGRDPRRAAHVAAPGATVVIPRFDASWPRAAQRGRARPRDARSARRPLVAGRGEDVGPPPGLADREPRSTRASRGGTAPSIVEDLDSANGTFVDGRRVERATLRRGRARGRRAVRPRRRATRGRRLQVLDTRQRARLDARGLGVDAGGHAILSERLPHPAARLASPPSSAPRARASPRCSRRSAAPGAPSTGQVLLNGADLYRGVRRAQGQPRLRAAGRHRPPRADRGRRASTTRRGCACLRTPAPDERARAHRRGARHPGADRARGHRPSTGSPAASASASRSRRSS